MILRAARVVAALGSTLALAGIACGDVTSDLITEPSGGSATGGSVTGGSATGGSATGGSATGGSATGGSANSTGAGSGGMPECTTNSDCAGMERLYCHPSRRVCVECTDEAHCDAGEDCSDEIGECANRCTSSADCTDDDDRFCDTLIGFCVECLGNEDCPPPNQCFLWQCGEG